MNRVPSVFFIEIYFTSCLILNPECCYLIIYTFISYCCLDCLMKIYQLMNGVNTVLLVYITYNKIGRKLVIN